MGLTLKERKAILNNALPKFDLGTIAFTPPSLDDTIAQAGSFLHSSTTLGVTSAADAFKADVMAQNNPVTKKAGAGLFLKNNAGGIMSIASGAIDFIGTMGDISKNKISSDEMMGSGGTTNESANGISYQLSKVDEAGYQSKINATAKAGTMAAMGKGAALGGAIGSVIPGLGTVAGGAIGGVIGGIAGLFGSSKAKREAERQKQIAIDRTLAANTQNRENAYTIGLRNEFNRENRTDTSQSLFHAELGVQLWPVNPNTGETFKKLMVNTSSGKKSDHANAMVGLDEDIISSKGRGHKVKEGPNDTAYANLKQGDSVITARPDVINPLTGRPIIEDADALLRAGNGKITPALKKWLDMNLHVGKMMMYAGKRKIDTNPGYLGGTLKKFDLGDEDLSAMKAAYYGSPDYQMLQYGAVRPTQTTTTSTGTSPFKKIGSGLKTAWNSIKNAGVDLDNLATFGGAILNTVQRNAQAEGGIRAPKSFVANPYENAALDELNKLHSDYYTVWAGNREAEGRAKSAIAQSGGLSGGQRMLAYMGMLNQTLLNNANAMFDSQKLNNEYAGQAAKIKLATGENSATRQAEAYRWDEDMLAKAHAARLNLWETSAYDRQNALTQYFKNRWEKDQFDRTMNLYESQLEIDKAATQAMIDSLKNNNTSSSKTTTTKPTLADVAKSVTTSAGRASLGAAQLPQLPQLPEIPTIAPKVKDTRVEKTPTRKKTTSKKITLTKDSMGQQFANIVATPQKKNKPVTTKAEEKKSVKPVKKYTPIPFGNAAIQERFPDASEEAKKDRPFKERAGRPAATTNSELRRRAVEWFVLGKKRYEEKYGKD